MMYFRDRVLSLTCSVTLLISSCKETSRPGVIALVGNGVVHLKAKAVGEIISHRFELENQGQDEVSIVETLRNCSCTDVTPETAVIAPAGRLFVDVTVRVKDGTRVDSIARLRTSENQIIDLEVDCTVDAGLVVIPRVVGPIQFLESGLSQNIARVEVSLPCISLGKGPIVEVGEFVGAANPVLSIRRDSTSRSITYERGWIPYFISADASRLASGLVSGRITVSCGCEAHSQHKRELLYSLRVLPFLEVRKYEFETRKDAIVVYKLHLARRDGLPLVLADARTSPSWTVSVDGCDAVSLRSSKVGSDTSSKLIPVSPELAVSIDGSTRDFVILLPRWLR